MKDIIVIGGGPAGLGSAIYAKRAELDVLLLEKDPFCGGQILNTETIDNYLGLPSVQGFEIGTKFREHADTLGVEIREETVTSVTLQDSVKRVITDKNEYEAKTVILATGAGHALLQVPGEKELMGRGVSYCATCDGAFFRKKEVAVVGGGDVAVGDAIYLARMCSKVYLIHRRDQLRAAASLQKQLFALPNVEVIWNTKVESVQGSEQVTGVEILTANKALIDASGKGEKAGMAESERRVLPVSGVFVAVGILPHSELFRQQVACDEKGYVLADENCETNIPGVYVAGDLRHKKLRQVITAVSDGAQAAVMAAEYIERIEITT